MRCKLDLDACTGLLLTVRRTAVPSSRVSKPSAGCVQDRIVRAFLIEEQKVVKKVLKESQQKKR